jgi:hypothetical protein
MVFLPDLVYFDEGILYHRLAVFHQYGLVHGDLTQDGSHLEYGQFTHVGVSVESPA